MKDKLGGRRFWMCCGAIGIATGLVLHGNMTGAEWVGLATWIIGIYCGANLGQRGIEAAKEVKTQ